MQYVPNILRILLSLYFLTCQPLFTPVLYGLKMSKIRIIYTEQLHINYVPNMLTIFSPLYSLTCNVSQIYILCTNLLLACVGITCNRLIQFESEEE
ncbi:hypothetical protein F7725_027063 [Dissostichus mawsoni]|uniref:Uncharacterized protein n=1 Tax=Dissostichus mawsoni TaxID=36200 RepID=A0A7J5XBX2_DISMA|nr:hypothetical protein F7725_027063 [Dissostichus mawsoni]